MKIIVLSRAEIEAGNANGADAVVSIRSSGPSAEPQLTVALAQATQGESARLLKLYFDDIGVPCQGKLTGPTMSQIGDAIEFGRRVCDGSGFFDGFINDPPRLVVHCEYGRSRSAAIALALLADQLGPGGEEEAVRILLRDDIEGRMQPNPLIISLADSYLFRYGRIDAALIKFCPRYVAGRLAWRRIAHSCRKSDTHG